VRLGPGDVDCVMSGYVHGWWWTRDDMSGEVRMFRAHTWELLWAGRFVVGRSRVLDYGWGGP